MSLAPHRLIRDDAMTYAQVAKKLHETMRNVHEYVKPSIARSGMRCLRLESTRRSRCATDVRLERRAGRQGRAGVAATRRARIRAIVPPEFGDAHPIGAIGRAEASTKKVDVSIETVGDSIEAPGALIEWSHRRAEASNESMETGDASIELQDESIEA